MEAVQEKNVQGEKKAKTKKKYVQIPMDVSLHYN
jgi:hypothetical protein